MLYKRKGDVSIYDTYTDFYSDKLNFAILVINDKEAINIYPFYKLTPPKNQSIWLLRFIKKRYGNKVCFKNQDEMIDYILDEENKRLTQKK
jgi:hypothetical protein